MLSTQEQARISQVAPVQYSLHQEITEYPHTACVLHNCSEHTKLPKDKSIYLNTVQNIPQINMSPSLLV
jgi:hypothetical protein